MVHGLEHSYLNLRMRELLGADADQWCLVAAEPPAQLALKLARGFEWDSGKLIYRGAQIALPGESESGFEYYGSKTYINDFRNVDESPLSLRELIGLGFGYAIMLAESIFKHSDAFTVYLVGHLKDEYVYREDCCVQFHLDRPGTEPAVNLEAILHPEFQNPTAVLQFRQRN